jgi:hypothetical protein
VVYQGVVWIERGSEDAHADDVVDVVGNGIGHGRV